MHARAGRCVALGECRCARVDWVTYCAELARALRRVEKLVCQLWL